MISFRHSLLHMLPLLGVLLTGYAGAVEARYDFGQITRAFEERWNELAEELDSPRRNQLFLGVVEVAEEVHLTEGATNAATMAQGNPPYVNEALFPSGRSTVFGVAATRNADVVLLDNGFDQGFRVGMLCEVSRQGVPVGEIVLVEVKDNRAAALILNLQNNQQIKFGDVVRIKTVQYHS